MESVWPLTAGLTGPEFRKALPFLPRPAPQAPHQQPSAPLCLVLQPLPHPTRAPEPGSVSFLGQDAPTSPLPPCPLARASRSGHLTHVPRTERNSLDPARMGKISRPTSLPRLTMSSKPCISLSLAGKSNDGSKKAHAPESSQCVCTSICSDSPRYRTCFPSFL